MDNIIFTWVTAGGLHTTKTYKRNPRIPSVREIIAKAENYLLLNILL